MEPEQERLLEQGLSRLRALLGPDWKVEQTPLMSTAEPLNLPRSVRESRLNHLIDIQGGSGRGAFARVLIEVTTEPSPAAISRSAAPRLDLMRQLTGDAAVLVIASWLSPRTREVLEDLGYGYLDLTGSTSFRLPQMGVLLQTIGEQRDPSPRRNPWRQQLRGDKAGWLVRVLADVLPPYRGTGLAQASGLSLGYVSKLLDAMQSQRLIRREGRTVVDVDWAGLLRERAAFYRLLKAHPPVALVAQRGIEHVLGQLQVNRWDSTTLGRAAVTGSVAAATIQPLTVGGQLMIHIESDSDDRFEAIRRHLSLLPATSAGADVLLLHSTGSMALRGRRLVDGVPHVAMSQLVLDCLSGPGRMPAEGSSILEYLELLPDASSWRRPKPGGLGQGLAVGCPPVTEGQATTRVQGPRRGRPAAALHRRAPSAPGRPDRP